MQPNKEIRMRYFLLSAVVFIVSLSVSAQKIDSTNYYIFNNVQSQLEEGNKALNFEYVNENGEKISLRSLKGKIVYLDIWASYCSYCVSQIPQITALQKKYPEIAVIRISVDEREQAWRGASDRHNIDGYNLWANGMSSPADKYTLDLFYFDANKKNKTPASFELSNPIPGYVLIDQRGYIVQNWAPEPGTEELDDMIKDLLY